MTGAEAKAALINEEPVILGGITYKRIRRIMYEAYRGGISVSAELESITGNSTSISPIRYIERTGEKAGQPNVLLASVPVDSIVLRTYAGEFRIELSLSEEGVTATESGIAALPLCDAPYSEDDSIIETWRHVIGRVRDVAAAIIGDWYEARGLNRFTGVPMNTETKN